MVYPVCLVILEQMQQSCKTLTVAASVNWSSSAIDLSANTCTDTSEIEEAYG